MRILVTGARGFIGARFVQYNEGRYQIHTSSLRESIPTGTDLQGIDVIVHFAGKAHDMRNPGGPEYYHVNVGLTMELARKAKEQGIQQFIYISSVKVYDDSKDEVFYDDSACSPTDDYGKSKLEAEKLLRALETENLKIAIVRPPLVYGPGVKGNMLRILKLASKGYRLPLGNTGNKRSMVFLDNLIELINRIIDNKASGIFIAGDERPLGTDELIAGIRNAMDKKPGLVNIPDSLRGILKKTKPGLYKRLFGSFVIDNYNTNKVLKFVPPYSSEHGIAKMVEWYLKENR